MIPVSDQDINEKIGEKIIKLRQEQNLTTTDLARMVGLSQAQISRLENAKQGFRSKTLVKIAQALGVHPSYFYIDGDPEKDHLIYASIAHPTLAKALQSPIFLAEAEKLADIYLNEPSQFKKVCSHLNIER